ncbi:MAG TPA: gamma-glutamylcyclotransferase family protein [Candidatus Acidoferrales bacterium]|nr:gamma-glutamylcyclotransferase family protein [Candidatus Acidoferrales bacterium]
MAQRYIILFQYGSNMNPDRLNSKERLDGAAEFIGVAKLPGWGIRFDLYSEGNDCAVTDIVPNKRETVQGALYRVPYRTVIGPRGQRSRMDEIEGAGLGKRSNYKRQKVSVLSHGKRVEARTYIGTVLGRKRFLRRSDDDRRVSEDYFDHLLVGARRFHFSDRYIVYLRKQAFRWELLGASTFVADSVV